MTWYKKAYNIPVSVLNQYLRKGFSPSDYLYLLEEFIEKTDPEYLDNIQRLIDINKSNLFQQGDLYYGDIDFYLEKWIENATPEQQANFQKWVEEKNLDTSRDNAPPYESMEYRGFIKPTWLVHFTDDPDNISTEGFQKGWPDISGLGYTTYYSKEHREPGYNFAFDAADNRNIRSTARTGKYGKHAVLFWGSGVEAYHYGDEEHQIIVWGPSIDTNTIVPIYNQYDKWVVERTGKYEGYPMFESEDINDVINWAINNINMIRQTLKKWKPQQRKQKASSFNGNWYKKAQKLDLEKIRDHWEKILGLGKYKPNDIPKKNKKKKNDECSSSLDMHCDGGDDGY